MGLTAVLFVVLALAIVALAVAAWAAGYSRGVEDTARPMAEWYRHHMGDSKTICGNESHTTDKLLTRHRNAALELILWSYGGILNVSSATHREG